MMRHALVIPAYPLRRSHRNRTCSLSALSPPPHLTGVRLSKLTRTTSRFSKARRLASCCSRCSPGGIREPHWHPSAWELNIVTSGVAAWVVIDGNGNHESFDQHVGEIVFAPQGSFHYFSLLREPWPGRHEHIDHPKHQCA